MKKIPSLFERDQNTKKVVNIIKSGSEWVTLGEGRATIKRDGIALRVLDGVSYKRYDAKAGRTPPPDFEPAQPHPDPHSGHWPGWVPTKLPDDRWLLEGVEWGVKNLFPDGIPNGTYEVCGPRIGTRHGANPENLSEHRLYVHGEEELKDCPRTYNEIVDYLKDLPVEGIVWHHPDGSMVKIKKSDFPKMMSLDNTPNI